MAKKKEADGVADQATPIEAAAVDAAAPVKEPDPASDAVGEVQVVGTDLGQEPVAFADAAPEQPTGAQIEVTCLVAAGRRRANRRWPGGTTRVAAHDLTEEDIKALEDDPMFTLVMPAADAGV